MEEVEFWVGPKDGKGFSSHSKYSVLGRGGCRGEGKEVSVFRAFFFFSTLFESSPHTI